MRHLMLHDVLKLCIARCVIIFIMHIYNHTHTCAHTHRAMIALLLADEFRVRVMGKHRAGSGHAQ